MSKVFFLLFPLVFLSSCVKAIQEGDALLCAQVALSEDGYAAGEYYLRSIGLYEGTRERVEPGGSYIQETLAGRGYWRVHFRARDAGLGGDVIIFIDASSCGLLSIYRGK